MKIIETIQNQKDAPKAVVRMLNILEMYYIDPLVLFRLAGYDYSRVYHILHNQKNREALWANLQECLPALTQALKFCDERKLFTKVARRNAAILTAFYDVIRNPDIIK